MRWGGAAGLAGVICMIGAVVVVVAMVIIAQGKRPPRKDTAGQALVVDVIPARVESLNFSVVSQGPVAPRTETTLVAEVSGQIVSVSSNFIAGGFIPWLCKRYASILLYRPIPRPS